jgi:hypothetical protein
MMGNTLNVHALAVASHLTIHLTILSHTDIQSIRLARIPDKPDFRTC